MDNLYTQLSELKIERDKLQAENSQLMELLKEIQFTIDDKWTHTYDKLISIGDKIESTLNSLP